MGLGNYAAGLMPEYPRMERQDLTQSQLGSFKFRPIDNVVLPPAVKYSHKAHHLARLLNTKHTNVGFNFTQNFSPSKYQTAITLPTHWQEESQFKPFSHPSFFNNHMRSDLEDSRLQFGPAALRFAVKSAATSPYKSSQNQVLIQYPGQDKNTLQVSAPFVQDYQFHTGMSTMNPVAGNVPSQMAHPHRDPAEDVVIANNTLCRALYYEQQAHITTQLAHGVTKENLLQEVAKREALEKQVEKLNDQNKSLVSTVNMLGGIIKHNITTDEKPEKSTPWEDPASQTSGNSYHFKYSNASADNVVQENQSVDQTDEAYYRPQYPNFHANNIASSRNQVWPYASRFYAGNQYFVPEGREPQFDVLNKTKPELTEEFAKHFGPRVGQNSQYTFQPRVPYAHMYPPPSARKPPAQSATMADIEENEDPQHDPLSMNPSEVSTEVGDLTENLTQTKVQTPTIETCAEADNMSDKSKESKGKSREQDDGIYNEGISDQYGELHRPQPTKRRVLSYKNVFADEADSDASDEGVTNEDFTLVDISNPNYDEVKAQGSSVVNNNQSNNDEARLPPGFTKFPGKTVEQDGLRVLTSFELNPKWKITKEEPLFWDTEEKLEAQAFNPSAFPRDSPFSEHPVRYFSKLEDRDTYRTVMIDYIPLGTKYADVLHHVRGGTLESVQLFGPIGKVTKYMTARIVFLFEVSASSMEAYARNHGICINGTFVRVWVVPEETYPPNKNLSSAIQYHDHTRLLLIDGFPDEKLINLKKKLGGFIKQNLIVDNRRSYDDYPLIEFTSIQAATQALEILMFDKEYKRWTFDFEVDPCSLAYDKSELSGKADNTVMNPEARIYHDAAESQVSTKVEKDVSEAHHCANDDYSANDEFDETFLPGA